MTNGMVSRVAPSRAERMSKCICPFSVSYFDPTFRPGGGNGAVNDEISRGLVSPFSFSCSCPFLELWQFRIVSRIVARPREEGLIASINQPGLAESSQTSTINSASTCRAVAANGDVKSQGNNLCPRSAGHAFVSVEKM